MKLRFGDIFAQAGNLWRSESALLVPLAAIFFFLPVLAVLLVVPIVDLGGLEGEARAEAMLATIRGHLPWTLAQAVVQTFGVGTILTLLLDPARPTVGEAIRRAFVRLPGLLVARLCALAGVALGLLAFVVPGLYLIGRTFLTSSVYIAEPARGPVGAAIAGFERTVGNGWLLFLVFGTVTTASQLLGSIASQGLLGLPAGGWITFPFVALVAAGMSAIILVTVLLEAAAYRSLPVPEAG
jgi:hypothetical protein